MPKNWIKVESMPENIHQILLSDEINNWPANSIIVQHWGY